MHSILTFWETLKLAAEQFVLLYGLPGLFLLSFTEHFIQPVPPDPFIIGATALGFSVHDAVLAVMIGGFFGSAVGYGLGKWLGEPVFIKLFGKKSFTAGHKMFEKYGVWAIIGFAFTPIPFKIGAWLAGIFEMHFWKFLLAVAIGRLPRYLLMAYGGQLLANFF